MTAVLAALTVHVMVAVALLAPLMAVEGKGDNYTCRLVQPHAIRLSLLTSVTSLRTTELHCTALNCFPSSRLQVLQLIAVFNFKSYYMAALKGTPEKRHSNMRIQEVFPNHTHARAYICGCPTPSTRAKLSILR